MGYDISLTLRLPLDVLITRKLGTPANPELAMGALAETGYQHLNEDVIREYGVSKAQLEEEVLRQKHEIDRRIRRYREDRTLPSLKGQTVILVDDGIATGATFFASLGALLKAETAKIIAAVPIAPPRVLAEPSARAGRGRPWRPIRPVRGSRCPTCFRPTSQFLYAGCHTL